MPTIVGVRFREVGKVYYFDPKKDIFQKGEGVIVETSRGVEFGTIVLANQEVEANQIKGELKPIIRKATEKDIAQHNANIDKREKAIKDAQEKADKHKLEMKVVDAEFTFDNSKVTIYFTSENRVDFRELVKELASQFHMRIELRQIGIRDECKMKGGLGPCGLPCCCNAYMSDFERVSIKMAKNQGLSLNPTKISGLCGRLMCCLKFENAYYAETLRLMPKVGTEFKGPDGKGTVENIDMLYRTVTLRIPHGEDTEIKTYTLDQLGIDTSISENVVDNDNDDEGDDSLPEDESND